MQKVFRVDPDFHAYDGFFDPTWTKQMQDAVRGTAIDRVVFDLLAAWKGLSNARRLPMLMVQLIRSGIAGAVEDVKPMPLKVLHALADRVLARPFFATVKVPRKARPHLRREIKELEAEIAEQVKAGLDRDGGALKEEAIWNGLRTFPDFAITLWMAEVNAYAGVYFAYEDYLVRAMKLITRKQGLRVKDLAKEIAAALGQPVVDRCWDDRAIEKARLVRHALAHNGRRMTGDLGKFRSELMLEGGEIVVLPAHTDDLYNLLKDAALEFARAALAKLGGAASP